MKKHLFLIITIIVFALSSCEKTMEYDCNEVDQALIPFFSLESNSFNGVEIGLLNRCNEGVDDVASSNIKIENLHEKVYERNTSITPDISGIEEYIDYYSNSRKYRSDIVSYDIFDSYNGTLELAFIYDSFLQIDLFTKYYDSPIEGKLNDFELTSDYYKMRYYVNDDYLYFVQYHNDSGSQFTVTRIYFTMENQLIYDHLTYYKEGKSFNYEYTYYQEGIKGVQAKYRRYDDMKGMLNVREADFQSGYIEEFHVSNYINPMYKLHIINPNEMSIIEYVQELDKYELNKEIYRSDGFVYGERYDNYQEDKYDYRYNITQLDNWDYYFQNALYLNENELVDENSEVFVNTKIKLEGFINISQHFEYVYHSGYESSQLPNNLLFKGLSTNELGVLNRLNYPFVKNYFDELLNERKISEVELLDIWGEYVPEQFLDYIEKNK